MLGKLLQQNKQVGLYVAGDGIAVAEIDFPDDASPTLKSCQFIAETEPADQLKLLKRYIKKNNLKKQPCNVVFNDAKYKLFLLALPAVEESELIAALSWSLKDQIGFPVEEAVIDIFHVPVQKNREEKVYVAVSQKSDVTQTIGFIKKAGLKLACINVEELSLGNLIEQMEGQERGIAVVHFDQNNGAVNIYRDSELYISRKIDIGLETLQQMSLDDSTQQHHESIILELQRTMDFYESEFAKPPIGKLVVTPKHPVLQGFCDYVTNQTGMLVELINLAQIYPDSTELDDEAQSSCLLAIAAAARKFEIVQDAAKKIEVVPDAAG